MKHISSVHVPFLAGYSYNIALPGHLELLLNHWCPLGIPIVVRLFMHLEGFVASCDAVPDFAS